MTEVGDMHGRCRIPGTLAVLVAVGLGACSQLPTAASYPMEAQHKMQSVNHWSQFARSDAERIAKALKATGDTQVCIADPMVRTTFNQGFISYLGVYLHQRGLDLAACGGEVPVVMLTTQVVAHMADRSHWPTGKLTEASAILATDAFMVTPVAAAGAAVGSMAALDLSLGAQGSATDTELVVTTRVQKANFDIAMFADGFYINDEDWQQYSPPVQQQATLRRLPEDHGVPGLCHGC